MKNEEYPKLELNVGKEVFRLAKEQLRTADAHNCIRDYGCLKNEALYLDEAFNWKIVKDEYDTLCLIAYDKGGENK